MGILTCVIGGVLGVAIGIGDPPAPPARETQTVQVGEEGARIVGFVKKCERIGFSGAVLAARNGRVVAAVAVGSADLEGKEPNTPATLFEIASATKQFTAAAVLRLVQDGKLKLDDPIGKALPGVPANCAAITIRHLLGHTSGIPGTNSNGGGTELEKVLPIFLAGGPRHEPGTHWEYWNQGYALASELVARGSGKAYTAYCKEALFAPAGMSATCFTGDAPPKVEGVNVAVGRSVRGEPRSALAHPYGEYGFQYRGMGGVVTNVWDLWRWDRALHNLEKGGVLGAGAQQELFKPGLNDYALGWFVRKDGRGKVAQSHGGGVRGFVCEIRRLPEDDGCVWVLANRDDAPVKQVAEAVQTMLFGGAAPVIDAPGTLAPDRVAEIVGTYADAKGNVLMLREEGGVVRATIRWSANAEWTTRAVVGADGEKGLVFIEQTGPTKLTVSRDNAGGLVAIELASMRFERTKP